ncbi:MAG: hypothetical protein AB7U41_05955, partial [Dongiaceae bacterium]
MNPINTAVSSYVNTGNAPVRNSPYQGQQQQAAAVVRENAVRAPSKAETGRGENLILTQDSGGNTRPLPRGSLR